METRKEHWEQVYATKQPHEVSWTQERPETSLELIRSLNLPKTASIIDVGGGDSRLVDCLLDEGYQRLTVLDISEHAIERARKRLGEQANNVTWVVSDILDFVPRESYDLWHDRATFHFLTAEEDVEKYISTVDSCVTGHLTIGTFSEQGPIKCSGLQVTRYSEQTLAFRFQSHWHKLRCKTEDHQTPFGTQQNFLFCAFARI